MNVDNQGCFNVNSTLMCLLGAIYRAALLESCILTDFLNSFSDVSIFWTHNWATPHLNSEKSQSYLCSSEKKASEMSWLSWLYFLRKLVDERFEIRNSCLDPLKSFNKLQRKDSSSNSFLIKLHYIISDIRNSRFLGPIVLRKRMVKTELRHCIMCLFDSFLKNALKIF